MRLFRHIRAIAIAAVAIKVVKRVRARSLPLSRTIARLLQEQRRPRRRRTDGATLPLPARPLLPPPARPPARFCLVGNRHPDGRRCGPRRRRRRPLHF